MVVDMTTWFYEQKSDLTLIFSSRWTHTFGLSVAQARAGPRMCGQCAPACARWAPPWPRATPPPPRYPLRPVFWPSICSTNKRYTLWPLASPEYENSTCKHADILPNRACWIRICSGWLLFVVSCNFFLEMCVTLLKTHSKDETNGNEAYRGKYSTRKPRERIYTHQHN